MRTAHRFLVAAAVATFLFVVVVAPEQRSEWHDAPTVLTNLLVAGSVLLLLARGLTTRRRVAAAGVVVVVLVGAVGVMAWSRGETTTTMGHVPAPCDRSSVTWVDPELSLVLTRGGHLGEVFFHEDGAPSDPRGLPGGWRTVHVPRAFLSVHEDGRAALHGSTAGTSAEAHRLAAPLYEALGLLQPPVDDFHVLAPEGCGVMPLK